MIKNNLLLSTVIFSFLAQAQIGIGTVNPHASSILEVNSNTKGFLPPRIASDGDVASPTEGLVIYDESDNCLNIYNGNAWVNMCNGNSSSAGNTNVNFATSCDGAFTNISTFGNNAYHKVANVKQEAGKFSFHLNADGSKLYSNRGHYFDQNSDYIVGNTNGTIQSSVEVVALSQAFPGKKWVDFIVIDHPTGSHPVLIYLLSDEGTLHSMALSERSATPLTSDQIGVSSTLIDPNDNNKYLKDPGTGNNDYRFTPYNHIVDDNNPAIKFSSIHISSFSKSDRYTILAYDGVGKKFYSLGARTSSTWVKSKSVGSDLLQTSEPTSLKESVILSEANLINELIAEFSTEFEEGDGKDITYFSASGDNYFITKDGYINVIKAGNKIYRSKLIGGVKPRSFSGHQNSPVLGYDGKIYKMRGVTTTLTTSHSLTNLPTAATVTHYESTVEGGLFSSTATNLNTNINIKRITWTASDDYNILAEDGKVYRASLSDNVLIDFNANYGVPLAAELLASQFDMILKSTSGTVFGINTLINISTSVASQDIPTQITAGTALDINGNPILDRNANRTRLIFNCFGN